MTLEEELQRASEAQDILDRPLVREFLDTIRENLRREFENSKASDKEGREEVWRMMKVVNSFESHLINIIATGRMAEKQLSLAERAKNIIGGLF